MICSSLTPFTSASGEDAYRSRIQVRRYGSWPIRLKRTTQKRLAKIMLISSTLCLISIKSECYIIHPNHLFLRSESLNHRPLILDFRRCNRTLALGRFSHLEALKVGKIFVELSRVQTGLPGKQMLKVSEILTCARVCIYNPLVQQCDAPDMSTGCISCFLFKQSRGHVCCLERHSF